MAFQLLLRSARSPLERLISALSDPSRRDRTLAAVLSCYAALWTLYAVISSSNRDIHPDMAEMVVWSRELDFGTLKHPPLGSWLVRAWFSIFPLADWAYYLLSMSMAALALWIVWLICGRFLDGQKRVVGLAILTFIPFFDLSAAKLNPNKLLIPLWAATLWCFLRSYETRRGGPAAVAGLLAAAAMLTKYWSIFLLAGLALAVLCDPRRGEYFRSWAPWVTIAVGALALAPHVAWLVANDFPSFAYALDAHAVPSFASSLVASLKYFASAIGYSSVAVAAAIAATRPDRAAIADSLWPQTPDRRFAAVAFWVPLLLPVVVANILRVEIGAVWSMSAWTLLPVVLLSSPLVTVSHRAAETVVAVAIALPLISLVAAPAISAYDHRRADPIQVHGSLLVAPIENTWRDITDQPLRLVGGESGLPNLLAFYLPSRPLAINGMAPFPRKDIDDARIDRNGIVFVCPARDVDCVSAIEARAARGPAGRRVEAAVSRRHFGVEGQRERYVIITIPPKPD